MFSLFLPDLGLSLFTTLFLGFLLSKHAASVNRSPRAACSSCVFVDYGYIGNIHKSFTIIWNSRSREPHIERASPLLDRTRTTKRIRVPNLANYYVRSTIGALGAGVVSVACMRKRNLLRRSR